MFAPDYLPLTKIATLQDQATRTYRTAIQTWEDTRPTVINFGIRVIGLVLITIALTAYAGGQTRRAFDWLYPRLRAAYQAFKDYSEPGDETLKFIRFEQEIEPETANPDEPIPLPAPADKPALESPDHLEEDTPPTTSKRRGHPKGYMHPTEGWQSSEWPA